MKYLFINTFPGPRGRGIFHPQGGPGLTARLTKRFIIFFYIFDHIIHAISFILVSRCAQLNFMKLNIFQIDDKDITTNNICEKVCKIFKWMTHWCVIRRFT